MPTQQEIDAIFPAMVENFSPDKAQGTNAVIQFDLTGENSGQYWVKIDNGTCNAGQGEPPEAPKMTISASSSDFYSLVTGKLNVMQAFMSGKIKVKGDMGLAMKMAGMFGLG